MQDTLAKVEQLSREYFSRGVTPVVRALWQELWPGAFEEVTPGLHLGHVQFTAYVGWVIAMGDGDYRLAAEQTICFLCRFTGPDTPPRYVMLAECQVADALLHDGDEGAALEWYRRAISSPDREAALTGALALRAQLIEYLRKGDAAEPATEGLVHLASYALDAYAGPAEEPRLPAGPTKGDLAHALTDAAPCQEIKTLLQQAEEYLAQMTAPRSSY